VSLRYRHQWTQAKLFRALWDAASRSSTKFILARLDEATHSAYATFDERKIDHRLVIAVDPSQEGYVNLALHELLHYILRDLGYVFPPELEEGVIVGIQNVLWPKIVNNPARLRRWCKLIEDKLKENDQSKAKE
jgi:hypothetical protein